MRICHFTTGEYYHVYNRGVDKRKVFLRYGHYTRFLKTIRNILETGSATYRPSHNQGLALKTKVQILCYCLMPNHYHFLLKQLEENGITEFMHKLDTSYTMYFNLNIKRTGRLFEYTFKAKRIESEELLIHVSRYIHLNPLINDLVSDLELWGWSSYLDYLGKRSDSFCQKNEILDYFGTDKQVVNYVNFVKNQVDYARLLKEVEKTQDENMLFI